MFIAVVVFVLANVTYQVAGSRANRCERELINCRLDTKQLVDQCNFKAELEVCHARTEELAAQLTNATDKIQLMAFDLVSQMSDGSMAFRRTMTEVAAVCDDNIKKAVELDRTLRESETSLEGASKSCSEIVGVCNDAMESTAILTNVTEALPAIWTDVVGELTKDLDETIERYFMSLNDTNVRMSEFSRQQVTEVITAARKSMNKMLENHRVRYGNSAAWVCQKAEKQLTEITENFTNLLSESAECAEETTSLSSNLAQCMAMSGQAASTTELPDDTFDQTGDYSNSSVTTPPIMSKRSAQSKLPLHSRCLIDDIISDPVSLMIALSQNPLFAILLFAPYVILAILLIIVISCSMCSCKKSFLPKCFRVKSDADEVISNESDQ